MASPPFSRYRHIVRMAAILAGLMALAAAWPAAAEHGPGIPGRWSFQAQACDAGNSEPVTLQKLKSRPEGYYGRCVAIVGAWNGNRLCPDRAPLARPYPTGAGLRDCIGAETWAESIESEWPAVRWVRLYGEVSNCDDFWAMASVTDPGEGALWEIAGYCHNNGGPDLRITASKRLINPAW